MVAIGSNGLLGYHCLGHGLSVVYKLGLVLRVRPRFVQVLIELLLVAASLTINHHGRLGVLLLLLLLL